ncbi:unnamed protein product [Heligmosomoides polygyrus]|uniref:Peptidase_M41 domain-containing protein n=1 Tax=Heligmosomoides polygyrus TaxID=6339 RepID=A0A183GC55_HELPZ|nr:unnamed protein product [Heligmosomoides polygyrus]
MRLKIMAGAVNGIRAGPEERLESVQQAIQAAARMATRRHITTGDPTLISELHHAELKYPLCSFHFRRQFHSTAKHNIDPVGE